MDVFSKVSTDYQRYRPSYPPELVADLVELVRARLGGAPIRAWDVATGTGQMARLLQPHCATTYASDGSANQLKAAAETPAGPIRYFQHEVPDAAVPFDTVDLVTLSQALHWFYPDTRSALDLFHAHLSPQGVLAVLCYQRPEFADAARDRQFHQLYSETLGTPLVM